MNATLQWIGKFTVVMVFFIVAKGVSQSTPFQDTDAEFMYFAGGVSMVAYLWMSGSLK